MHAPASVVVGMRYSRVVSRVMAGMRYFSSTRRRAEETEHKLYHSNRRWFIVIYHDSSTCGLLRPKLFANLQFFHGIHYEHSLWRKEVTSLVPCNINR